jgi:hypothetical protein
MIAFKFVAIDSILTTACRYCQAFPCLLNCPNLAKIPSLFSATVLIRINVGCLLDGFELARSSVIVVPVWHP